MALETSAIADATLQLATDKYISLQTRMERAISNSLKMNPSHAPGKTDFQFSTMQKFKSRTENQSKGKIAFIESLIVV